jgi:hypothetical protein
VPVLVFFQILSQHFGIMNNLVPEGYVVPVRGILNLNDTVPVPYAVRNSMYKKCLKSVMSVNSPIICPDFYSELNTVPYFCYFSYDYQ